MSALVVLMVLAIGVKSFAQNLNSTKAPIQTKYSSKPVIFSESFDGATFHTKSQKYKKGTKECFIKHLKTV